MLEDQSVDLILQTSVIIRFLKMYPVCKIAHSSREGGYPRGSKGRLREIVLHSFHGSEVNHAVGLAGSSRFETGSQVLITPA
jgi:hypothetical protein